MSPTVYLVSGASRGIGLAIVTLLAARPDAVVFAGAREPAGATELRELAEAHPDRFHVVKLISPDKANNIVIAEEIKRVAGRLDVVIANAAVADVFDSALELRTDDMIRHFEVNTNGPLVLFQATYQLLKESKTPKFVAISSGFGSIANAGQTSMLMYPYGASKAALNWVVRKLHRDFPEFVIFPISPGTVATDGARQAYDKTPGIEQLLAAFPPISAEESARGVLEQIDVATRETHGGQFVDYTGLGKWDW
ncbi:NAD(P)-binding protein [Schizophyllum commune H4-8]|uniref:NAD(P)-binding protein n=1 Tax=Schizophyllum commune (strain H4-8 / FGSC 9210) TaxID=578458 RepID=D8QFT1_SCHCM|nr:NAD(P)-binding protein [Schizophyllum commune H4-8]KAI5887771.1 NAD(P)-binding protein [Schizophyllum commune H4-8]